MSLKVKDVMVKNIVTIGARTSVKKAVELMNKHEIGCLIVVNNEKPVGIVTERDMLKRVLLQLLLTLTDIVRSSAYFEHIISSFCSRCPLRKA